MPVSAEFVQYVLGQLGALSRVSSRRMFGGAGLYCGGLFFGLIMADTLYFKVGDANRRDYESRGMDRFRPYPGKADVSMTYYEVPADVLEDGEELIAWARRSVAVAAQCPRPVRSAPGRRRGRP
ncbi:MAG: TfoX/Sxy family protein [Steroidobacteraceae bacterium]